MNDLTGVPGAIEGIYPKAKTQLHIVHIMRDSLIFFAWKDRKIITVDLERIYRSTATDDVEAGLEIFCQKRDADFLSIGMV